MRIVLKIEGEDGERLFVVGYGLRDVAVVIEAVALSHLVHAGNESFSGSAEDCHSSPSPHQHRPSHLSPHYPLYHACANDTIPPKHDDDNN